MDQLGRGARWVRIGNCMCEDTPELRAMLRAEREQRRAMMPPGRLALGLQSVRHALAEALDPVFRLAVAILKSF